MFNENSRVKIPVLVHMTRLGYEYLSLKDDGLRHQRDLETNTLTSIFKTQVRKLNPDLQEDEINCMLENIRLELGNDDLGRAFYNRLGQH
ncbi:MAG: hypothetical protein LBP35_00150 [Candidatus Ancillula trichonymphae]|nr:hypothetical protein [Candidatus Ancillula trichonymphae]